MNDNEKDLILKVLDSNAQLKRLYSQHVSMKERLSSLKHRPFLTRDEEMEAKLLKKKKLHNKDQMMELIAEYR